MQEQPSAATLTRSERLLEMLRLDIVRGLHQGGTRLTEEALAERYGVSRTPVREALRLLTQESLLTYTPRLGYTVESINIAEMDDLYAVRIAIEEQCASRIVLNEDLGALLKLLDYWREIPSSVANGDLNLVFADELFHETLAEASGSTVLPPMLKTINGRLHALRIRDFMNPERVRLTFQQHASILRGAHRAGRPPRPSDPALPYLGEPCLREGGLHRRSRRRGMTTGAEVLPTVTAGTPDTRVPALSVRALTKRFADVLASDSLDMDFYRGEVHAVLGENGAGKSTLVKMLYGFYEPDEGEMFLDGERVSFDSPADARKRGIGMVFQNFTLIPAFTVWENVALVNQSSPIIDRRAVVARINELSQRYGLEVRPDAYVRDLSIGEQQRAEILKALSSDPAILILDEPTSVLAPHEVSSLLGIVRRLRDDGFAIILITHKLGEVFACADRVIDAASRGAHRQRSDDGLRSDVRC